MSNGQATLTISEVHTQDGPEMYVALMPAGTPQHAGLIPQQILGKLMDPRLDAGGNPRLTPENFARNGVFVDFMHDVIRRHASADRGIVEFARHGNPVAIVDLRSPSRDSELPLEEDIIGVFDVEDGKLASYQPNPDHRVLSGNGFCQLPEPFQSALVDELATLIQSHTNTRGDGA
jgi:hypothetical protein